MTVPPVAHPAHPPHPVPHSVPYAVPQVLQALLYMPVVGQQVLQFRRANNRRVLLQYVPQVLLEHGLQVLTAQFV